MAVKDDDDDDAPAVKDEPVKLEHDKPAKAPSMAKPAKAPALGPKSAPKPPKPPPPKADGLFAKAAAAKKAAEAFRQRRQRVNPARPGDKPVPKRNLGDRIKYLKPKRLKSLQHKLLDEGLSLGAVGIACALLVFLLAWCRRRYRRKRRGLPLHTGGGKGHKQRGLFGPSEVVPNDVQQACRTNRSTVVEAWLRRCGSPDARASDAPRRSVLHIAAAHGAANVCRAALLAGADPNLCDDAGDRPLHLAAASGSGACVKVLLDHGADASLPDALGQDAKTRARNAGNTGCGLLISKRLAAQSRADTRIAFRGPRSDDRHQA
ncbi:unnamed protein product [Pelagomonas calceolata]|uniref:Uncharacterized protein n=1 Tax=Pelagomonas calceolata TaxID=35677 RepID=A0A7S4EBA8_9STRA|nr:unnamed protein product [Pelagomonas calceolata]|mmetsp:Transcript_19058/g.56887  ORF Transcript_19058/g.56887 Transcript_19058/m.56887 type:complete len:320 (+) Transcript_19058:158-1117(+)